MPFGAEALEGELHPFGSNIPTADIVLLGEVHDNPIHHRNQAYWIEAIGPTAVVFEMLSPDQATTANSHDGVGDLAADLQWAESGWPDFEIYAPIFAAVPKDAVIYGAAVPRDDVRSAFRSGAASQLGGAELVPSLPSAEQEAREEAQFLAHCEAMPLEMMPNMVEAQRFRDARFAQSTVQALEDTGGPVIVITGNGHARTDWGIPIYLDRLDPKYSVISVGQLETGPTETPPYDLWVVTAPAERTDPCAAFR